ncbi:hypothetical protein ACS127_13710 [Amphibacillus sp. Q70]|uniref:hypothetical protein n=1 Tax=Amphibacillus sp. Q70 TaxID=3453416 RepID=UPI003F82F20A
MAKVMIKEKNLHIQLKGIRKLLAFKRQILIPLEHVSEVTENPDVFKHPPKILEKRLGTNFYGLYMGGWFKQKGERVFWDVRQPKNAIVISLKNERFKSLVIDVDHPEETVREIRKHLN